MNEPVTTPLSRDQIQAAYTKLAAEVGDLFFALDNAKAQMAALEARLTAAKEQRAALQKAYQEAAIVAVNASEVPTPTDDPA